MRRSKFMIFFSAWVANLRLNAATLGSRQFAGSATVRGGKPAEWNDYLGDPDGRTMISTLEG